METVWNKDVNVASSLFPNSQSLVLQRLDEKEMMSMALAESLVTAQLEQFRFGGEEMTQSDTLHNESDDDWDTVRRDLPDSSKSEDGVGNQVSSKQCHDNNNNNAKSKSQSTSEVKKGVQKTGTKICVRKSNEKARKVTGNTLKESCASSKQGPKEKDDSLNLSNDDNKPLIPATDAKTSSVAVPPKFTDKYGKFDGFNNRPTFMGKGARMKEQQLLKQHFSMFNDTRNKNRSLPEGSDENTKSAATRLKPRVEPNKKYNEIDDTKKCHKIQVMRTQSYNAQYNRSKPLLKSQQRYTRTVAKVEHDGLNKQQTSGFNTNVPSAAAGNEPRKRYDNEQNKMDKEVNNIRLNQGISEHSITVLDSPECTENEASSLKFMGSVSYKAQTQNSLCAQTNSEKYNKDDQGYVQKCKRDSSVYRRSSDYSELKNSNGKAKVNDYKKNVDNNSTKDYKASRTCPTDVKLRSQPESAKATVKSAKTDTGANKTNKTDISDTTNIVQSAKLPNSYTNQGTKVSLNTSIHTQQESQTSQACYNRSEVQSIVKTEHENNNNNCSNNKQSISNTEAKSVKFSDNVQEINASDRSVISYSNNPAQQVKGSVNLFYSDVQSVPQGNSAQQAENHQNVQSKNYYDNSAQYNDTSSPNVQNTDHNLHFLDVLQHKPEQTLHITSQTTALQNTSNPPITAESGFHYQSMPAMYLNQYNNMQALPRKTTDNTTVSQNTSVPSTPTYSAENQNMMHNEPSNILMHNNHASILPPPGFHNHPMSTQYNQWNVPFPEMLYFGNMITSAHPLNVQMQNSRQLCGTDFNNIQQASYLQQPLIYVPPLCMQSWNPLLQYPTPLFQNTQYPNCSTFPTQYMPSTNLTDSINCTSSTTAQNNPYKQFQQIQHLENNPTSLSTTIKYDNYLGNVQGYKSNTRMKDMDAQMRPSQYRAPVPNEYQNYSQDGQVMTPFSYPATLDSISRNGQSSMHIQMNQKYHNPRLTTANYQRMSESSSSYQNLSQDSTRKNDMSKNDSESVPPMVSPRECMYYGFNYSRKTDNMPNSTLRAEMKPMAYMHSGNSQHCVPQFYKNATYHVSPRDVNSRVTIGRGGGKVMEQ